ncbi:MAG: hypothetical protein AAF915_16765 [Cyanobacteria bacterium P01_D01_bin.50]
MSSLPEKPDDSNHSQAYRQIINSVAKRLNLAKLKRLVRKKKLTESLELLENLGYSGDTAIHKIQYLQLEGTC